MRVALFLIVMLCANSLFSQNVLWEKRLSWPGIDFLSAVIEADSGNYLAVGLSNRYGVDLPFGRNKGIAIVKFTEFGDTLFTKHLGGYYSSSEPKICSGGTNIAYVVARAQFSSTGYRILKVDYNGEVISAIRIPNDSNLPVALLKLGCVFDLAKRSLISKVVKLG